MAEDNRTQIFSMPQGPPASLICVAGSRKGEAFPLSKGTFTIGRLPDCSLPLTDDGSVSRVHAKIIAEGMIYVVYDNESRNGTLVNGNPVRRHELKDGDQIQLCHCVLHFHRPRPGSGEGTIPQRLPDEATAIMEIPPHTPVDPREYDPTVSMARQRPTTRGPHPTTGPTSSPQGAVRTFSQSGAPEAGPPPRPRPTTQVPLPAPSRTIPDAVISDGLDDGVEGAPRARTSRLPWLLAGIAGSVAVGALVAVIILARAERPDPIAVAVPIARPAPAAPAAAPANTAPPAVAPAVVPPVVPPPSPAPVNAAPQQPAAPTAAVEPTAPAEPEAPKNVASARREGAWRAVTRESSNEIVLRSPTRGVVETVAVDVGGSAEPAAPLLTFRAEGRDGPATVVAARAATVVVWRVAAGDTVRKGQLLGTLAPQGPARLTVLFPRAEAARGKKGAAVDVRLDDGSVARARVASTAPGSGGTLAVLDIGTLDAARISAARVR